MKKLLIMVMALALVTVLAVTLVACGGDKSTTAETTASTTAKHQTVTTVDTQAADTTAAGTAASDTTVADITASVTSIAGTATYTTASVTTATDTTATDTTASVTTATVTTEAAKTLVTTPEPVSSYPKDNSDYTILKTPAEFVTAMQTAPSGKYVLGNDIDFTDVYMEPLCAVEPFSGTLNGAGFSIKNLKFSFSDFPKVDEPGYVSTDGYDFTIAHVAIIAKATGNAVFTDLKIDSTCLIDVLFDEDELLESTDNYLTYIAALVAESEGASFENITNKANLRYEGVEYSLNYCHMGGIVAIGYGNFTGCRNEGTLFTSYAGYIKASNATLESQSAVGGIIATATEETNIKRCINTGTIFFMKGVTNASSAAAGICGQCACLTSTVTQLNVEECGNVGDIYFDGRGQVAGIVGYDGNAKDTSRSFKVSKCFNKGNITNLYTSNGDRSSGVVSLCSNGTIEYCFNTGDIAIDHVSASGIAGWLNAQGGSVNNCYNIGNASCAAVWITAPAWVPSNVYFLNTNTYPYFAKDITDATTLPEGISGYNASDLKDTLLADSEWVADDNNINGGFPILSWMTELEASDLVKTEPAAGLVDYDFYLNPEPIV